MMSFGDTDSQARELQRGEAPAPRSDILHSSIINTIKNGVLYRFNSYYNYHEDDVHRMVIDRISASDLAILPSTAELFIVIVVVIVRGN